MTKTIFKLECGSCKRIIYPGEEIEMVYNKYDGTSLTPRQAMDLTADEFRSDAHCSNCVRGDYKIR